MGSNKIESDGLCGDGIGVILQNIDSFAKIGRPSSSNVRDAAEPYGEKILLKEIWEVVMLVSLLYLLCKYPI